MQQWVDLEIPEIGIVSERHGQMSRLVMRHKILARFMKMSTHISLLQEAKIRLSPKKNMMRVPYANRCRAVYYMEFVT